MKSFIICLILIYSTYSQNYYSKTDAPGIDSSKIFSMYVVNHGWHTGVVMKRSDIIYDFDADSNAAPNGKWLEFGWGDRDFYMSTPGEDDVQWFTTIKAAIWPTSSVMHVVGFDIPVQKYYSQSGLIGLEFPDSSILNIVKFIISAFDRTEDGRIDSLARGLYGKSYFFSGREKYYFPKTCNVWTARAIREGGIDLGPYSCQKSSVLMERLKGYGTVIRRYKE